MDELIIDEKRYVSSKQAAKITGYAKDYIGQLCREGRVPARLVGRSWYVLEAAIHDHRFGSVAVESAQNAQKAEDMTSTPLSAHMETPKYEPISDEILSPMPVLEHGQTQEDQSHVENLQESWQSWFAQIPEPVPVAAIHEEETQEEETGEVAVPVKAIHHTLYEPSEALPMPQISRQYSSEPQVKAIEKPQPSEKMQSMRFVAALQLSGALLALIAATAAALGTGYFDSYLLANKGVSFMAGVSLYNK